MEDITRCHFHTMSSSLRKKMPTRKAYANAKLSTLQQFFHSYFIIFWFNFFIYSTYIYREFFFSHLFLFFSHLFYSFFFFFFHNFTMEIVNASQGQVFEQRGEMVEWIKDYCKERGIFYRAKICRKCHSYRSDVNIVFYIMVSIV